MSVLELVVGKMKMIDDFGLVTILSISVVNEVVDKKFSDSSKGLSFCALLGV